MDTISYETEKIVNGVIKSADAMALTLGSSGANAILDEDFLPGFIITNDGYSILNKIEFKDPLEEIGKRILFDSVGRANTQSGDGSTTTAVLTRAILENGIASKENVTTIKNSLDECIPLIEKIIDEKKRQISVDEVADVARISSESKELGQMVQKIYQEIGKEGIISLDNSNTFDTYFEIKNGISFNCGSISPILFNSENSCVYKKPLILVTKQKIATVQDVMPLFDILSKNEKKEIVIFCDDISDPVSSTLVMNHVKGMFQIAIVKAPIVWKQFIIEDFAIATGATVVSTETGVSLKDVQLEHLGTCGKIIITKNETTLLEIADVSRHIETLKEKGDEDSLRRVAWLSKDAAVVKLGANSSGELKYKHDKVEDAIHAAKLALEDGVVIGGGVTYLDISKQLPDTVGGNILKNALTEPIKQIARNTNVDIQTVIEKCGGEYGLDAVTGTIVNMNEYGIIDPAKILKNSIRNAISVASTALTIKVAVKKNRTEEDIAKNFISKQQRNF